MTSLRQVAVISSGVMILSVWLLVLVVLFIVDVGVGKAKTTIRMMASASNDVMVIALVCR